MTRATSAKGGVASRERRRAVVLHVAKKSGADPNRSEESRLEEAVALTAAIGLEVVESLIAPIARATPATLIGAGKVAELKALCADSNWTAGCAPDLVRSWTAERAEITGCESTALSPLAVTSDPPALSTSDWVRKSDLPGSTA